MTVRGHIAMSVFPGGFYFWLTGDAWIGLVALVASILIDVDHVVDRIIEERSISSLSEMVRSYMEDRITKVYLFLHSLDILVPLWILVGVESPAGAVIFGFIFHIACDIYQWVLITRKVHIGTYLFAFRLWHGFRYDRLLRPGADRAPVKPI